MPFAGAFLVALFLFSGGFARGLLSAKKFLPLVIESPDRRWAQIGLNTSVGANDQVDIKDTSFGPRKDLQRVTKTLQITHYFESARRAFGASPGIPFIHP